MRDLVAAHFGEVRTDFAFANAPAPQAPARNPSPSPVPPKPRLETFNSHRKRRPRLGDRRVYRPVRRHTLSRIEETPPPMTSRPRSRSLQHSTDIELQTSVDFSSTRPILRSRSNISADTSRSVPVCNQSQELEPQVESGSPQYAEPRYDSGSEEYEREDVSVSDLPVVVPVEPAGYLPYPEYTYYQSAGCHVAPPPLWKYNKKRKSSSKSNLYLAFMY